MDLDTNISVALANRDSQIQNMTAAAKSDSSTQKFAHFNPEMTSGRETVVPLGSGVAGGKVSKVVPWDPQYPTFARIEYYVAESYENDVRALKSLKRLNPSSNDVSVVEIVSEAPPTTLNLEYVEGKTLHNLVTDPRVPDSDKSALKIKFLRYLETLSALAKNSSEVSQVQFVPINDLYGLSTALKIEFISYGPNGAPIVTHVLIKSDNVIIDSKSGDMILVDPL